MAAAAMLLALLVGCGKGEEAQWGATCQVYLEGLPQEYQQLPQAVREDAQITLRLRSLTTDDSYSIHLEAEDGYRREVALMPGSYEVSGVYLSQRQLALFQVEADRTTIQAVKDQQTQLPIRVIDPETTVQALGHRQPGEEILALAPFSRRVQYQGRVVDLEQIGQVVAFQPWGDELLAAAQVKYVPAVDDVGVALVIQNQQGHSAPAKEAQVIGVRFTRNEVVLPGGLGLGLSLAEIAHVQRGILGTPSYCLGSPMLGTGLDDATLVYLDPETGDRLSLEFRAGQSYLSTITYEFQQYK